MLRCQGSDQLRNRSEGPMVWGMTCGKWTKMGNLLNSMKEKYIQHRNLIYQQLRQLLNWPSLLRLSADQPHRPIQSTFSMLSLLVIHM